MSEIDDHNESALEEHNVALSRDLLEQAIADDNIRARVKMCPICENDFLDDGYFGEVTCGSNHCIEEYEKITGRRLKKRSNNFFSRFQKTK